MTPRCPLLRTGFVLLAALSCDGSAAGTAPSGPDVPGSATISLEGPHDDVGALVITIRGPALAGTGLVPARETYDLYARSVSTEEVRVVVVGDVADGPLFTLSVGARGRPHAYTASVDQVATRTDVLRRDLTGYRAVVSAVGSR